MKLTRENLGRALLFVALTGAGVSAASCDPVPNSESAVLLVIRGSPDFINMVVVDTQALRVTITEAGVVDPPLDAVYDMEIGGWPVGDDANASVLLIASMTGDTRVVSVTVWACDNTQCNATMLGQGMATINFRAGEQLNDVTVFIEPL